YLVGHLGKAKDFLLSIITICWAKLSTDDIQSLDGIPAVSLGINIRLLHFPIHIRTLALGRTIKCSNRTSSIRIRLVQIVKNAINPRSCPPTSRIKVTVSTLEHWKLEIVKRSRLVRKVQSVRSTESVTSNCARSLTTCSACLFHFVFAIDTSV